VKGEHEQKLYFEPFFDIVYFETIDVLEKSWDEGYDMGDFDGESNFDGDL